MGPLLVSISGGYPGRILDFPSGLSREGAQTMGSPASVLAASTSPGEASTPALTWGAAALCTEAEALPEI